MRCTHRLPLTDCKAQALAFWRGAGSVLLADGPLAEPDADTLAALRRIHCRGKGACICGGSLARPSSQPYRPGSSVPSEPRPVSRSVALPGASDPRVLAQGKRPAPRSPSAVQL